jgi:hypothetical protein
MTGGGGKTWFASPDSSVVECGKYGIAAHVTFDSDDAVRGREVLLREKKKWNRDSGPVHR